MVQKKWQALECGECTFWERRRGKTKHASLVIACPKCGEPIEVSSDLLIVNRDGVQIHIVRSITCPGDFCGVKFYCRVGKFEFIK